MTQATQTLPSVRPYEGIWRHELASHPFTPVLERAQGIYLYDTDGRRYLDVTAGAFCVNIGHGDRRVVDAIARQAEKFAFCHHALSNQPKAQLCARIAEVAPGDLNTTYPVSGGSEAVETAIKLARAYHLACGRPQKYKVIGTWDSYHGMSLGALSVAGAPGFRQSFYPMLSDWPHVRYYRESGRPAGLTDAEWARACARELEELIHFAGPEQISAFIATPVGAGKDYALVPPREYWQAVREICDRYDVLLIVDEVVTGFGRTGRWFGMEHFDVQADIMVTGKGISSVYLPLAAVTVSDRVNEPFARGEYFIHGFTGMGHPLACAAGLAAIDVIASDGLVENAAEMGRYLFGQRDRLLAHRTIAEVRGTGLLMVLELVRDKATRSFFPQEARAEEKFQTIALKNGIVFYMSLFGPRRPTAQNRGIPLFVSPPLIITRAQIDEMLDAIDRTLDEWAREMGI